MWGKQDRKVAYFLFFRNKEREVGVSLTRSPPPNPGTFPSYLRVLREIEDSEDIAVPERSRISL